MSELPTFEIERVFAAPIETVWRAWTEPQLLARWFGPQGCRTEFAEFAVRPGGVNHYSMDYGQGPMWGKLEYVEVEAPKRLCWRHMFSDEQGNVNRHPASPDWPLVLMTTVELTPRGEGTHVKLTWVPIEANARELAAFEASFEQNGKGWGMGFTNLEKLFAEGLPETEWTVTGRLHVRKGPEATVVMHRRFSAPRELVFRAFTEPALLARWNTGPGDGWTLTADLDVRDGGSGTMVWSDGGEKAIRISTAYEKVDPPARIEQRDTFGGGGGWHTTTVFEEEDGVTTVHITNRFASEAMRDQMFGGANGWWGMEFGYQKLEKVLAG